MAIFNDLQPTETVEDSDEILLHQNDIDKRVNFEVATAINWATLQGYTYEGVHELGTVYTTLNSFATSSGIAYFPKYNTTVPYTSTSSNPATDSNLTKQSYRDYKANVDAVRDIGSTLKRFDATDPNDLYPWQTWLLIQGDVSIRLGDGTLQSTTTQGNNTPAVPLLDHAHTMNHDHPTATAASNGAHVHSMDHDHPAITTSTAGDHAHSTFNRVDNTGSGEDGWHLQESGGEDEPFQQLGYTDTTGSHNHTADIPNYTGNTGANTEHTHTVDIPNYVGNTGSTGESTPTLDVRGAFIKMNLWLRTA